MNIKEIIKKKIAESEKRIRELFIANDLRKIEEGQRKQISEFYLQKSLNRFKTAQLIFRESSKGENYSDYSEVVSAAYYAMYR